MLLLVLVLVRLGTKVGTCIMVARLVAGVASQVRHVAVTDVVAGFGASETGLVPLGSLGVLLVIPGHSHENRSVAHEKLQRCIVEHML